MQQGHILIVGCGDLGRELGRQLIAQGYTVTGVRRSEAPLPYGIKTFCADACRPETLHRLAALQPDIVIYSVAADAQSDECYRAQYVDGLRNVLNALKSAPPRHVFFVSSTRVYGQSGDDWLDEQTPALPADFGGERLLEAEHLLDGLPATRLRLSGIYGPGRTRLIRLAQDPQKWPAQNSFGNRIHRDDAAAFIAFLVERVYGGAAVDSCYIVTDGHSTPQYEVLQWIAQRLGIESASIHVPPIKGGKRLGNTRMLSTGFSLQYPDYRAGYDALVRAELPTGIQPQASE